MVTDPIYQELSPVVNGIKFDDFFAYQHPMNEYRLEQPSYFHDHENFVGNPYPQYASTQHGNGTPSSGSNPVLSLTTSTEGDSLEDSEIFSDITLTYISRMLMEEDIDEKVYMYQQQAALRAAEKPFYDILGEKYPPSPDQTPLQSSSSLESTDASISSHSPILENGNGHTTKNGANGTEATTSGEVGSVEYTASQVNAVSVDSSPVASFNSSSISFDYVSPSSLNSSYNFSNGVEAVDEPQVSTSRAPNLFVDSHHSWHFRRGVEEAKKFLPPVEKLIIDFQANRFSLHQEPKQQNSRLFKVKTVDDKDSNAGSRGRKNPNSEDLALQEGRSNKQSAVYSEETLRSEIFDMVLLCNKNKCQRGGAETLREASQDEEASKNLQKNGQSKGSSGGKGGRRKKQGKKDVVDLRTLLIHCAQAVAADDHRTSNELLKQVRQHSSPFGDGSQRLAYCFADGLEARLAGTGSQIYQSLVAKRTSATDFLKAYQLYLGACPFKKISHFLSNQTILNVAEKASTVHIIDFGIYFGFQWPCLIQRLSSRPGGPPKLRITGIDVPQPGFRPTERIEETGRRLADYARSFNVPFEYNSIASKWETIKVEDLKVDEDEVLIVNCLYRFRNLVDETVIADSPRNMVLNSIRKANPDVFIHGIINGSYSAPFFVTRFREALFHYSALFDMLETTVPREDAQRMLIERDLFGREALNVISCEGSERVERPETYKQWQVRNLRAGFEQLPLDPGIMKKARDKVKNSYHKDFVIDEDSGWLLQGWKGRIIYAVSTWRPSKASSFWL